MACQILSTKAASITALKRLKVCTLLLPDQVVVRGAKKLDYVFLVNSLCVRLTIMRLCYLV